MADKKDKKAPEVAPSTATPTFDPKPVRLGDESILDRLLPHVKKIMYAIVATAVVLGVIFFVIWLRDRKRAAATEKLAAVIDLGMRPVKSANDLPDLPDPKDPKAAKPKPKFNDAKERAVALLDALAKQDADGGSTYRASLLVQAGKLDDAIAEYRKGTGQTGMDGVIAREGLGIALELRAEAQTDASAQQRGLEEALATFQAMQPDEAGPRRAYALYHQGRLLGPRLLHRQAEAKTALDKAKELAKNSELAPLIDEQLAALGAS